MTISLRAALAETLAGWHDDLDPAWRPLLDDLTLDFGAVDADLVLEPWEPIFPPRRGRKFPGAPAGGHIFRALDGIAPADVKCVIVGQDPYPCAAFATGRAFEAGNVASWRELEKMFSESVRSVLQAVCETRTGEPRYGAGPQAWPETIAAIESGAIDLPAPDGLLDHWGRQGVLALNAAFTLSRFQIAGDPHQVRGHLPLWRPVVRRILRHLADREGRPVVFLIWGEPAAEVLATAEIEPEARTAGRWGRTVDSVAKPHPADGAGFLAPPNTFEACNAKLTAMGATPIRW